MKECDFCGAQNEDWMKICINCGHELKDAPKEKKIFLVQNLILTSY